jgi:hypothetical protein
LNCRPGFCPTLIPCSSCLRLTCWSFRTRIRGNLRVPLCVVGCRAVFRLRSRRFPSSVMWRRPCFSSRGHHREISQAALAGYLRRLPRVRIPFGRAARRRRHGAKRIATPGSPIACRGYFAHWSAGDLGVRRWGKADARRMESSPGNGLSPVWRRMSRHPGRQMRLNAVNSSTG